MTAASGLGSHAMVIVLAAASPALSVSNTAANAQILSTTRAVIPAPTWIRGYKQDVHQPRVAAYREKPIGVGGRPLQSAMAATNVAVWKEKAAGARAWPASRLATSLLRSALTPIATPHDEHDAQCAC